MGVKKKVCLKKSVKSGRLCFFCVCVLLNIFLYRFSLHFSLSDERHAATLGFPLRRISSAKLLHVLPRRRRVMEDLMLLIVEEMLMLMLRQLLMLLQMLLVSPAASVIISVILLVLLVVLMRG